MIWNRWTTWVLRGLVVVGLTGVVGCKQQLFMEPGDYQQAVTAGLPPFLEENPHNTILPADVNQIGKSPATVMDPNRPPRYVTLKECIATAMEQGNIGIQQLSSGLAAPGATTIGFKNENLVSFNGQSAAFGTDAIRAFALDPANIAANIERSLSKFDVRWTTSMSWQKIDQPVAAQFLSFQQQRDAANLTSSLVKPLPTGGLAGITFSVDYSKFGVIPANLASGFVNPNYTPRVQFVFEQPLLQLFGVEVNQLSNTPVTSQLIPGLRPSGGQGVEGILITRIRFDQARAEFERNVNWLLVNVEAAYWNLYAAYYNLYAQEEGLRQSYEGYRFTRSRVFAGLDPPQQLPQSQAQLELFRSQVYTARGRVLETERQLRGLMSIRSDDGFRLVPIDEPNLAPYHPDFYEAANEAMMYRPELLLARQEIKVQQLNMRLQKNLRRPDLRFFSSYDIAGLGTRLDGSEVLGPTGGIPGNAFASLSNNQFNSWTLGLRLDMPLGFRDANAQVRQANLQLTRTYIQLRDQELKALETLIGRYRLVVQTATVIPALRARREYLQEFLLKFRTRIELGTYQSQEYLNYLTGQRDLAQAISDEFGAIAQYNTSLAELEFSKGTILRYNNIHLSEGPLPPGVRQRAVDHERERAAAIKLRERPAADPAPVSPSHVVGPAVGAPTLPPLTELPPSPDLNDTLPAPRPVPGTPGPTPPGPLPTPKPLPKLLDAGTGAVPPAAAKPAATGDAMFTPTGTTVTVPRFQPVTLPTRTTTGAAIPSPPSPPSAVPPLPPVSSGIPPTLPVPGPVVTESPPQ